MGLASGFDAWIVTVGNELLIGRVVNTNLAWLGARLTLLGYKVRGCLVVPDILDDIAWAFKTAVRRGARVIISSGGLGPTFDDKTAEGLAKAFNLSLVLNEEALKLVKEKYEERGLTLTEPRVKMAMLPEGSSPIPNPVGTAPGVKLRYGRTLIFLLPGVPTEMKAMFLRYVEPQLKRIGPKMFFVERSIRVLGLPESEVAPIIERVLKISNNIYIKSHPKGSELGEPILELHITASGESRGSLEELVEKAMNLLLELLSKKAAEIETLE